MAPEIYPPGDLIREELEARGWTESNLARKAGMSPEILEEILSGNGAITRDCAIGLGAAFGTGPEFWENLERFYRESLARAEKSRAV